MRRTAVVLLSWGVACSDGESPMPDSGVDAGLHRDARVFEIAPPAAPLEPAEPALGELETFAPDPPAAPVMTPCLPGWNSVVDETIGGVIVCVPPADVSASCAADEAQFSGEVACASIGASCPADQWPEGLPAGRTIIYVRPGGGGGDGSIGAPFGSIGAAIAAAAANDIIALAKGTYEEEVSLSAGLTLWGACPGETLIRTSSTSSTTVTIAGTGTELRDLSLSGRYYVLEARGPFAVALSGVLIAGGRGAGIIASDGAMFSGERVVIRDVHGLESDGTRGRAIQTQLGATVELSSVVVERVREAGVVSFGENTRLVLSDLIVRDTLGRESDGASGFGVLAHGGGRVEVRGGVIAASRSAGVAVLDAPSSIVLEDLLITETSTQQSDASGGYGIAVFGGGSVSAARSVSSSNAAGGAVVLGPGSSLQLVDALIADSSAGVLAGGVVTSTRVIFARAGIVASDLGSRVSLTDVSVLEAPDEAGVALVAGARATLLRVAVEDGTRRAVFAGGATTALSAEDLHVRGNSARTREGCSGGVVGVAGGARVEVRRAMIEENAGRGIEVVDRGSNAVLQDLIVRRTEGYECDGAGGVGLVVARYAECTLERGIFEANRDRGLWFDGGGTVVHASDIVVRETLEDAMDRAGGEGIIVSAGAAVELQRARVTRNRVAAMRVSGSSTSATLEDLIAGEISLGRGLEVTGEATVKVSRARVSAAEEVAAFVHASTLEAEDVVFADAQWGVAIGAGAQLRLTRAVVERAGVAGLLASDDGSRFEITDLVVRDAVGSTDGGLFGRGVSVQSAAGGTIARAVFERNREYSIVALEDGTIALADVRVVESLARACAPASCADAPGGVGLAALSGGRATMTRFEITASAAAGVHVGGGQIDLSYGLVFANPIGLVLEDARYDRSRVTFAVGYSDNDADVEVGPVFAAEPIEAPQKH